MIRIRAALGGDVHLTDLAAEFGRVDSGLHLELLQRVDGGQEQIGIEVNFRIAHAVQSEVIPLAPVAGDRDLLRAPVAA